MGMLEKINRKGYATHMPHYALTKLGGVVLLFCDSNKVEVDGSRIWKARYMDERGNVRDLIPGNKKTIIECCPTGWEDEDGWHVSVIAGDQVAGKDLCLYRLDGPSLDELSEPVEIKTAWTGHVYKDRTAWGEAVEVVNIVDANGAREIVLPNSFIYKVGYITDEPQTLLISGQHIEAAAGDVWTVSYNLETGERHEIECDGQPAYKCTVYGGEILYADRVGDFENRRLKRPAATKYRSTTKVR